MKNCVIVHGSPTKEHEEVYYDKQWIPWTIRTLEEKGIKTKLCYMPKPIEPNYDGWKKTFEKELITENTTLIGHSAGTTFLVRWLGETKKKIAKLILVAPWKIVWRETETNKEFCNYKIDEEIKKRVDKITYFTADNEEEDGKKSLKLFYESLGGKKIELKGHGHYCLGDMGTERFPELIQEVTEQ